MVFEPKDRALHLSYGEGGKRDDQTLTWLNSTAIGPEVEFSRQPIVLRNRPTLLESTRGEAR